MILAYRGHSWLSRAIQWQTDGEYSHVAWERGDGRVIGAWWPHGVRLTDDAADGHLPGTQIDYYRVDLSPAQRRHLEDWLLSQIGRPYDWRGILRFLSRSRRQDDDRVFCSELLMQGFAKVGVPLLHCDPYLVSPTWLVRSPLVHLDALRVTATMPRVKLIAHIVTPDAPTC